MTDLFQLVREPGISFAVVGATDTPGKYGGIIYRDLKRKGFKVFAVNPKRDTVDGDPSWDRLTDLPELPTFAVLVVPAYIGIDIVNDAEAAGIENVWVQPGAFSGELKTSLEEGGFNWLAGACVMVETRGLARSSS